MSRFSDSPVGDGRVQAAIEAERVLREAFHTTFSTPEGQIVLEHLRQIGFYYRSSIATDFDGRVDMMETAVREGRRWLVLDIESLCEPVRADGTPAEAAGRTEQAEYDPHN